MYTAAQLDEDASGYGLIAYVAEGRRIVSRGTSWTGAEPWLTAETAATFLGSLYAFVRTTREITIYRFHGMDPRTEARMLGSWWSPRRPALAIDDLGYPSWHNQSRSDAAVRKAWNPMSEVAEAQLENGSPVFVGRIAPVKDGARRLAGGDIQFLLPGTGHPLCLRANHAVR
jgi:hypothetical protein